MFRAHYPEQLNSTTLIVSPNPHAAGGGFTGERPSILRESFQKPAPVLVHVSRRFADLVPLFFRLPSTSHLVLAAGIASVELFRRGLLGDLTFARQ